MPSGRNPGGGPLAAVQQRERLLKTIGDRWIAGAHVGVPYSDVIHAHTAFPDGAAAASLARQIGRPLIVTEHS